MSLHVQNRMLRKVKDEAAYEAVMAEEVAYLYFGRDTCQYCRKFEPLMNEAIQETEYRSL